MNDSSSSLNLNNQQKNHVLTSLDSFQHKDSINEILVDKRNTVLQTSLKDDSSQISDPSSSSCISDLKNTKESTIDSYVSKEVIETKSSALGFNETESKIEENIFNSCDSDSVDPSLPNCLSNNTSNTFTENSISVDLLDTQISNTNNEIVVDDIALFQKISETNNAEAVNQNRLTDNVNILDTSFEQQHKICSGDEVVDSSISEKKLITECNDDCSNNCLDDSFTSQTLTDREENISNTINEEFTIQQSSELVNKSLDIENIKKKSTKKKKKKVLDVDECSWEDLYDKEDDYIHPLLMKEVSRLFLLPFNPLKKCKVKMIFILQCHNIRFEKFSINLKK